VIQEKNSTAVEQMKGGVLMARTIRRIRKSVQKIAQEAGLTPAQTRLAADLVQGICQSESCHLSEIGRALREPVALAATEHRLSEGLARPRFAEQELIDAYLEHVLAAARRMPFVAVDPTELVKPYGRAFPHLGTVRDASDRRKPLEPGYWVVRIEATDQHNQCLPLYTEVFSTKAPDYAGWHETFADAVERVASQLDNDAVWLFDRAFDALAWMQVCQDLGLRWVIRQEQTRHVELANGARYDMRWLVSGLHRPHPLRIPYVCKKTHQRKSYPVTFGFAPVRLPDLDAALYLIVVERPCRDPLVLLTNQQLHTPGQAAHLVLGYMRRWGVEDGIRFWKQKTGIEDLRVRNWHSIRRLGLLSMIACGLQALLLLTRPSLARRFIAKVKVFIPDVPFVQYRLWDGIRAALLAEA
jgi:hypothetical protein